MSVTTRRQTGPSSFSSLSPRARLTFQLSVAFAVMCVILQAVSFRSLVPPVGLVQAAIFGIIATLVARGSRRALLAAPIAAIVVVLTSMPFIIKDLGHPSDVVDFVWTLVALPVLAGVAVAGLQALRQQPAIDR